MITKNDYNFWLWKMITFVHILCYHLCYHFSRSANVIIFVLSFSLVYILCYHLCYHLMLSFIVIISPLFSFSWKHDTLLTGSSFTPKLCRLHSHNALFTMHLIYIFIKLMFPYFNHHKSLFPPQAYFVSLWLLYSWSTFS
jgi:hypothetical protein